MRHEHQISRLEPPVMDGMVVDVTEDGLGSKPVGRVVGVDELAKFVHHLDGGLLLGRNFTLLKIFSHETADKQRE